MTNNYTLSTERPILTRQKDLLDRKLFAENVARIIEEWKKQQSLVIALYGTWGCGKTSLKNMIVDALSEEDKGGPRILQFNPWQCGTAQQLTEAFFREVNVVLARQDSKETAQQAKERSAHFKTYGACLGLASTAFKTIGTFVPGISLIAEGTERIQEVLKLGSEANNALAEATQTLDEVRQELAKVLDKMKQPILVVLDDVDRLSADEIALLFQLIKANGDFPNFIYLVLCQRSTVERALEKLAPGAGRQFLEKIVQVPMDIPVVPKQIVHRMLGEDLTKLLGEHFNKGVHEEYWNSLFATCLGHYFEGLRDVRRFLNSMMFHVDLLTHNDILEVNEVDFVALQTLRVFEQGVYERLPFLTEELTGMNSNNTDVEVIRARFQLLLEQVSIDKRARVQELLSMVFPPIKWTFSPSEPPLQLDAGFWALGKMQMRAYHPDMFDRYFQFTLPPDRFSKWDFKPLIEPDLPCDQLLRHLERLGLTAVESKTDNLYVRLLVAHLISLQDQGKVLKVLVLLRDYSGCQKIWKDYPDRKFPQALLEYGDAIPILSGGVPEGPYKWNIESCIVQIIDNYLQNFSTMEKEGLLYATFQDTSGFYLPTYLIAEEEFRSRSIAHSPFDGPRFISDTQLPRFQQLCVKQINRAADDGRLAGHPMMFYILQQWKQWAKKEDENAPDQWVTTLIAKDQGLFQFIRSVRNSSLSPIDQLARHSTGMTYKDLSVPSLANRIQEALQGNLPEVQRDLLQSAQDAIRGKK